MKSLLDLAREVFSSLNAHRAKYVIIGGVAAIAHGVVQRKGSPMNNQEKTSFAQSVRIVRQSMAEFEKGKGIPASKVFAKVRKKLGLCARQ